MCSKYRVSICITKASRAFEQCYNRRCPFRTSSTGQQVDARFQAITLSIKVSEYKTNCPLALVLKPLIHSIPTAAVPQTKRELGTYRQGISDLQHLKGRYRPSPQ